MGAVSARLETGRAIDRVVARLALDGAIGVVKRLAEIERRKLDDPRCANPALHSERHSAFIEVARELVKSRTEIINEAVGG